MGRIRLISGRASPLLAERIAESLSLKLTPIEVKNFADGEIYVRIKEKVRGDDVFLIQAVSHPVNEHLMELLITIDALRRASAKRINVVCPYLAYSRQDRKAASREPITARLVANLIAKAGATRLLTVDLHADQIQGFYDIPVDHFVGYPQFVNYLLQKNYKDIVVVSPDIGGVKRARKMAILLETPLVVIDKRRREHNCAEILQVIGNVKNKTAVIVDDMIDTAGTVCNAADALKNQGAKEVIICATHGLLSGDALNRLKKCEANLVLLLDTVPLDASDKIRKIKVLSLAPLLAKVIQRIHHEESLGALFVWEEKEIAF